MDSMEEVFIIYSKFVQVLDPTIKRGFFKYLIYTVQGKDVKGPFQSTRSEKDFKVLKQVILNKWPGCVIPVFPPKSAFNQFEPDQILFGQSQVKDFCSQLIKIKHLWYCEETDIFLRAASFQKSIKKMLSEPIEELIKRYQSSFPNIQLTVQSSRLITCSSYLKNLQLKLEAFSKQINLLVQKQQQENTNMRVFVNFLMPSYEQNCMASYSSNKQVELYTFGLVDKSQEKKDYIHQLQINSYSELLSMMRIEKKRVKALQQAINSRQKYERQTLELTIKLNDKSKAHLKCIDPKIQGMIQLRMEEVIKFN